MRFGSNCQPSKILLDKFRVGHLSTPCSNYRVKPEEPGVKIGELASATATKVETVRYYEKIGLLPPPARTSANYRAYGSDHLARLSFIRRARDLGFSLEAVRELLTLSDDKTQSCEAVDGIARIHLNEIDRKIGDLTALRTELDRVIGSCRHGTVADCKIIETLGPRPN
ncbi:MAG: helix-turn-helix domain-containing protein [Sphingomonadales bacterium]|nr:helix-turn-helix domain-containing protein [Sphingomonadales bacterium]